MVDAGARRTSRYLTVGMSAVAVAVVPWLAQAAHAAGSPPAPASAVPAYLALGDSISYGYDPTIKYTSPSGYIGYPAVVGAARNDDVLNVSCPGDTSYGFVSATGKDIYCRDHRAKHDLHVEYSVPQLEFATTFLRSHPETGLVTVGIGLNDYWLCVGGSSDHCRSELPATVEAYRVNLQTIASQIRAVYSGPLVLVNYFALNYAEPLDTGAISRLDAVMAEVAPKYGAVVADEFKAFQAATAGSGGDGCRAGLLIKLPGGCDAHVTAAGRALMAKTIEQALNDSGARG